MTGQPAAGESRARTGGRSARRRARELALQGIYEWLVGRQELAAVEGHLMDSEGFDKADRQHLREVLHGVIDDADALRAQFVEFIDRRPEQLSPVEHGILLIGTYELRQRPEIPYRVVINEAVELAKSFGGTEGFKYVNGVLDKVAARLRPHEAQPR
ncbi:MAG: transcription antitermination factor NusB [Burkholderiaceae bacterium]|nr:transcription antitermination factor NusB [Burkholderiaceae bacterium]